MKEDQKHSTLTITLSESLSRGKVDQKQPFHNLPNTERNHTTNERHVAGMWAKIHLLLRDCVGCAGVSKNLSPWAYVCVFYMQVWALNVSCEGVWKRPDAGCRTLLCLSSTLPPSHRLPRWWMTPNEKFPLLDCWLQPAAVTETAICFPLQGPVGAHGLDLGFGYVGSTNCQASSQGGLHRNEPTHLWNRQIKRIKCLFSTNLEM